MSTGNDPPKPDLERLQDLARSMAVEALTLTCETVKQSLADYLKEELDGQMHSAMALHLKSCSKCRTEAESLSATLGVTLQLDEEAPAIRIINSILQKAIENKASDIHIEPGRKGLRVRLRFDGVLHEALKLPEYVHLPLMNRIKIMGDMNIAERRIPQDGRIHVRMAGKDYDLRASTFPFRHGEKAVMRILDTSAVSMTFDQMGMASSQEQKIRGLLHRPRGLLLTAGATGSGKTTVAYGMLNALAKDACNIVTVEDPVDFQIDGVSHIHVNKKAGLTYPVAIRRLIECDPDVLFVGEIQNKETAEAALEAALNGHLVISVMHASDAVGGIARLLNLGLDPTILSSALIGVVSLRLARRVCTECKQTYVPLEESLRLLGIDADPSTQFYKGAGCEACRSTGYRGRVGAFEVLDVDARIAEAITRRSDEGLLFETAVASGMVSIEQSAAQLVLQGVTSVEEALRVTSDLRERRGDERDG